MWNEPYLETCCRSTLHRVRLCQDVGRPKGLKDQPCLERLDKMGFVALRSDNRYVITALGRNRHDQEVARRGLLSKKRFL